jgi:hypothetical protein
MIVFVVGDVIYAQNKALRDRAALLRDRCKFYSNNPNLVCAVNPGGVDTDTCIDFRKFFVLFSTTCFSEIG